MSAAGLFAEMSIFQRKTAVFHLGSCSGSCCVLKEKRSFLLKDNNYPNNYPKEIYRKSNSFVASPLPGGSAVAAVALAAHRGGHRCDQRFVSSCFGQACRLGRRRRTEQLPARVETCSARCAGASGALGVGRFSV